MVASAMIVGASVVLSGVCATAGRILRTEFAPADVECAAQMPIRRHRIAVMENRARRLLSLPELGRSVTVFAPAAMASGGIVSPSVSASADVRAPKVVQLGVAVEQDIAMPITVVKRSGSAHTTGGGSSRARGVKGEVSATGRERAAETMWLAAAATFGGWVGELIVPTREAAALGALVGVVWGARQWRAWQR
jgi:hypothetical protein